jgi:hypothetical protein
MPTAVVVTPMEFGDQMFAGAKKSGVEARINRNGDRQIDFDNKPLTEDHHRGLFQGITGKKWVDSRDQVDALFGGSRPCAVAPFLDLAVKAGFATESTGKRFTDLGFSSNGLARQNAVRPWGVSPEGDE